MTDVDNKSLFLAARNQRHIHRFCRGCVAAFPTCLARAVLEGPDVYCLLYPMLAEAAVRALLWSDKGKGLNDLPLPRLERAGGA